MKAAFSEIPYVPPKATAKDYAGRALELLRGFEHLDPRLLAYMLAPSNILALAGLRSFSPYNDKLRFNLDMPKFEKLLSDNGLLWLNENPNGNDSDLPSYALVNFDVADHLSEAYPLDAIVSTGPVPERSNWGFFAWVGALDISFARAIENSVLPKQWLADWWSPHNIRFGMLLGYPGAAISSFVQSGIGDKQPSEMDHVTISSGLLSSPDVAFLIDRNLTAREDVATVIQLWQATLVAVYEVYPEERLMADRDFAAIVNKKI
ncbi:hypothetical protein [Streptomyces sp. NBC_01439]|uniref:hypothetical protein n=1 Tax=Streptomyces sp. NBC_01439 TaxID=2903867 RepID=UPI002E2A709D|nr:hypothetical protein [Streptomyces sp. NBC_01439]